MTNKTIPNSDPGTGSSTLSAIQGLLSEVANFPATGSFTDLRRLEKQVGRLVATIASSEPDSKHHAEALRLHQQVLRKMASRSKRKAVRVDLYKAAFTLEALSVGIDLRIGPPTLSVVFDAYNLGIDFVTTEGRTLEGLDFLYKAGEMLEMLGKPLAGDLLNFKLYMIDYGVAKAKIDLGDRETAKALLKNALKHAPKSLDLASWSVLQDVSRSAKLLSEIYRDEMKK